MKKLILCTLFWFMSSFVFAQEYANDWINPSQTYVKLAVAEEGIHRLSSTSLLDAGYDLSQINPDHLHLYFRGKEQHVFIEKNGAGQLNFLEFLGRRLDGGDDESLYREATRGTRDKSLQSHPAYSLFSDTSAYFLTWDQVPASFRFTEYIDTNYSNYTAVPHFRYESKADLHPTSLSTDLLQGAGGLYEPFYRLNSNYGIGEGFVGPEISLLTPVNLNIPTEYAANTSDVFIQLRILGKSRSRHRLRVELNGNQSNPVLETTRNQNEAFIADFNQTVNLTQQLSQNSQLTFYALTDSVARSHPMEAAITYNRFTQLNNQAEIRISDWNDSTDAFFDFAQADGDNWVYIYDVEHGIRNVGEITNGAAKIVVKGFSGERELYLSTDKGIKEAQIVDENLANLSAQNGAQLLIITDRKLANSAQAFATYRDTNQVNSLSSRVIYTDQIYDEFGFGSHTPLAIQRFCRYALENWQTPPEYVLLWGKAEDQIRGHSNNLVPTYGYPASDHYFVTPLEAIENTNLIPAIPIGRVNIKSNQEGLHYLNKVNTYEHSLDISWLNQGVFLGGGVSLGEQRAIESTLEFTQHVFDNSSPQKQSYLCLRTLRPTDTLCTPSIENGVGLIHYFGYASDTIQDIALLEASTYNHFGRFPLIIGMGGGGEFTEATSFGERWVLENDRGAIAYLGNSSFGYLNPLRDLGRVLYPNLYISSDQRLGDAIHRSLTQYLDSLQGIQYINHALQFNLQGDPSLLWRGAQTLTGINPAQPFIDFKLYPNPTQAQFVISYELPTRGRVVLRILDVQGRLMDRFQDKMGAGLHEFEWKRPDGMSEGIYFVQILFEGYVYSRKLIIQD